MYMCIYLHIDTCPMYTCICLHIDTSPMYTCIYLHIDTCSMYIFMLITFEYNDNIQIRYAASKNYVSLTILVKIRRKMCFSGLQIEIRLLPGFTHLAHFLQCL